MTAKLIKSCKIKKKATKTITFRPICSPALVVVVTHATAELAHREVAGAVRVQDLEGRPHLRSEQFFLARSTPSAGRLKKDFEKIVQYLNLRQHHITKMYENMTFERKYKI